MTSRWGMTVPLEGVPLLDQRAIIERMADQGYTDLWSAEAAATDAFTPLALASVWAPGLRLGTAIVPAYTRGPATLAMSAATLAAAAPGRFALGIGTSSNIIVERWNAIPFTEPYKKVRDTVRFLREALSGARVEADYDTFSVQGFTLGAVPAQVPPILVAALRPGMLRLAGREADGAVVNWLSAEDVRTVVPYVHGQGEGKEVVARIFVAPGADPETARGIGRRAISAYLNVPVYRAFHEWLGREELAPMWRAWDAGDRKGALAAVPDRVVDELVVHGPAEYCRERVAAYVENGVTTPVLAPIGPPGEDPAEVVRALAPRD
ncbi:LLM class F420-dependent oxidoreductase [Nocardiopsis flavescens]|uniref:Probable F420-dependent oxidoreductase, Rv3093c family n=1 Tax=Nocardiopsis flavescens TaxID=758803 RepID=A0A1M6MKX6_9ACTN|nr:LLM class F420-dependent oxidoreductase [Nocardiopsis flavescens]SHJ84056.1 probable F420-dependent oxidoreductase, Rv3093c family [Nocardiopsis flavescens]